MQLLLNVYYTAQVADCGRLQFMDACRFIFFTVYLHTSTQPHPPRTAAELSCPAWRKCTPNVERPACVSTWQRKLESQHSPASITDFLMNWKAVQWARPVHSQDLVKEKWWFIKANRPVALSVPASASLGRDFTHQTTNNGFFFLNVRGSICWEFTRRT